MHAILDFDGTICYGISMMSLFKDAQFPKKLKLFIFWIISKITGKNYYDVYMEKLMKGKDLREVIKFSLKLPPIKGVLKKIKELENSGYKIIILSYSAREIVEAYIEKYGIKAEVYAKEFEVKDGKILGYKRDWIYYAYLDFKNAKRKILEKLGIKPHVCIGDNKKRDFVCENYIDVRSLEKNYIPKWKQFILTRKIMREL